MRAWMSWLGCIGLVGCGTELAGTNVVDPDENVTLPSELTVPDVDVDAVAQAVQDALVMTLRTNLMPAWDGHFTALQAGRAGCPDMYVGVPEDIDAVIADADREDFAALPYWSDYCETPGGLYYRGFDMWDSYFEATGSEEDEAGRVASGSRYMVADAAIGDYDGVKYRFLGEGSDALYKSVSPTYERWVYSSSMNGTVAGRDSFEEADTFTPNGFRTDMYIYAVGGDEQYIEARGNVYLLEDRLGDKFDSVAMDLYMTGPTGAGADDCVLEPHGWMGLRDENAFWYDLVFLPSSEEDVTSDDWDNDEYSACDGCGTLYIRGLEAVEVGLICPDFGELWNGMIGVPEEEDFILTFTEIYEGVEG